LVTNVCQCSLHSTLIGEHIAQELKFVKDTITQVIPFSFIQNVCFC